MNPTFKQAHFYHILAGISLLYLPHACGWGEEVGVCICGRESILINPLIYTITKKSIINLIWQVVWNKTNKLCFQKNRITYNIIIYYFLPFFLPNSVVSNCLIAATPVRTRRGEGREPCVLRNTTQPSRTASSHNAHLTWMPATPMCPR